MNIRSQRWKFYKKKGGLRNIGHRCSEYAGGCIVCESYKFYDEHGKFPTYDEVHEQMEAANKAEHEKHKEWLQTEEGERWTANCKRASERRKFEYARRVRRTNRRRDKRLARKKV
jgi:hypothetical protein